MKLVPPPLGCVAADGARGLSGHGKRESDRMGSRSHSLYCTLDGLCGVLLFENGIEWDRMGSSMSIADAAVSVAVFDVVVMVAAFGWG